MNLASRITGIARPGSVLVAEEVREALDGAYRWSFAGERRVKGIDARVKLFRCRREDGGRVAHSAASTSAAARSPELIAPSM